MYVIVLKACVCVIVYDKSVFMCVKCVGVWRRVGVAYSVTIPSQNRVDP
jgi:hypothetical protein